MAANGISRFLTKEKKQLAKLDIAQAKRQGYSAVAHSTGTQEYNTITANQFGAIKVVSDGNSHTYLVFVLPIPAVQNYLYISAPLHNIRFGGNDHIDAASIAGPLVDCSTLSGFTQEGAKGYLLSTNLMGSSNANVGIIDYPTGRFVGIGSPSTTAGSYRIHNTYDITELPTQYSDNTIVDNPNPGGLQQGRPWKSTPNVLAGLWRSQYNGYFGDVEFAGSHGQQTTSPDWFDAQTPVESIQVTDFSKPEIGASIVSFQWIGYFRAPHTAKYIFYITSDDESYFWIGNNAITSYTTANANIWTWTGLGETASDSIALTAGTYYPIRLQWGNATGQNSLSINWATIPWVWASAHTDTALLLTNNNLTVSGTLALHDGYYEAISLGNYPINAGDKVMFSLTVDAWPDEADYTGIGIGNILTNTHDYPGYNTNSVGFFDDGNLYYDNNPLPGIYPTFGYNGAVVDIAVDRVSNLIWIRVDGGDWNGDPANDPGTATGGADISGVTGTVYPAASPYFVDPVAGAISINLSALHQIPTGFKFADLGS